MDIDHFFKDYLLPALIILLPNIGGGLTGSFCLDGIINWSKTLRKPSFGPPGWIFGPVWSLIYLCMGLSLYLIYEERGSEAKVLALVVFGVQLLLNMSWCPLFFGFHRIDLVRPGYI